MIKIKCNNHNYLSIFIEAYATHQKIVIIDGIKLKIVTQTQVNTSV